MPSVFFGDLHEGVRAEHAAEFGIVDAAVHVDQAAVVELLVACVAAVVILGAGAEGIAVGGAVGNEGVGGAALAPGIKGLALGFEIGEGAAVPLAGEDEIGGAEVGKKMEPPRKRKGE